MVSCGFSMVSLGFPSISGGFQHRSSHQPLGGSMTGASAQDGLSLKVAALLFDGRQWVDHGADTAVKVI